MTRVPGKRFGSVKIYFGSDLDLDVILRPLGTALDASARVNGAQARLAVMLLFVGGAITIASGYTTRIC